MFIYRLFRLAEFASEAAVPLQILGAALTGVPPLAGGYRRRLGGMSLGR